MVSFQGLTVRNNQNLLLPVIQHNIRLGSQLAFFLTNKRILNDRNALFVSDDYWLSSQF